MPLERLKTMDYKCQHERYNLVGTGSGLVLE